MVTTDAKRFQPQMGQMPADTTVHHDGTTVTTSYHRAAWVYPRGSHRTKLRPPQSELI